jgi:hypothetical protein
MSLWAQKLYCWAIARRRFCFIGIIFKVYGITNLTSDYEYDKKYPIVFYKKNLFSNLKWQQKIKKDAFKFP